ncbi:hypothetical protein FRX31_006280 [Thalictrum thalictroides]|uniref:Uncharacterized protein n=1 Tax=Thalictrum thalictroides TaxID=46969 RepID=A0A7J6X413_THATH|nr:hypothetical protein FRX31_006280 [Thalictrum thalictroides]
MEVHIIYIACNSLKLLRQGLRGDLDVAGCQLHPWNMEGAELQLFTSITMFACNLRLRSLMPMPPQRRRGCLGGSKPSWIK